ncbi:Protein of unknown function [Pyronema omphalodes CBS 100304]|uniref:Uncharacterized protein n=1 Tax=Pyronema omphalodes (strain CBS 100304) TaxID=1076935 RepID=U4KZD8_PYROM|nr:Protein of unknown function [Pyronema omphalodes CBS 100304]
MLPSELAVSPSQLCGNPVLSGFHPTRNFLGTATNHVQPLPCEQIRNSAARINFCFFCTHTVLHRPGPEVHLGSQILLVYEFM